jgi:hypothetical protein
LKTSLNKPRNETNYSDDDKKDYTIIKKMQIIERVKNGKSKVSLKFRISWNVAPCRHVEVDRRFRGAYCLHHPSEKSVNFNVTIWHYIPEDSNTPRCENLKSHKNEFIL